jgi:hypothetical protein
VATPLIPASVGGKGGEGEKGRLVASSPFSFHHNEAFQGSLQQLGKDACWEQERMQGVGVQ